RFHDPPVEHEQAIELLLLACIEVHPSAQQEPTLALDHASHPPALTEKLRPSHFIYRSIGVLHDVELVIDDLAVRSPLLDAQPVGLPHIHTGSLNPAPLPGAEFGVEESI